MPLTKVLIVEDESIVGLDIRNRLSRMGYQVVGMAVTGEEAVVQAWEMQPDLVLMDINLQGDLDGIEAATAIRSHFDIPVIYLTAYTDEVTLQRAKTTEPYGYLNKPFDDRQLSNVIQIALHKHSTQETRLQRQARQLQQIVYTMPQGVILLNANHRIIMANPQAQDYLTVLTDARENDVLTHLGNFQIQELLASPSPTLWHEINLTSVAHRIFEVVPSSIQNNTLAEDPENASWVLLIREVTQERAMQQRVQEQERIVAVGQLAAGIAHDFKNIIASVVLSAQAVMMRNEHLVPKDRDSLITICRQVMRGDELIKQILDFSRSSVMERYPIDIVPLLEEQTKLLERTLPENIKLELKYRYDPHMVNGDPTRILQVLMNLTLNARDAMPNGGTLQIELNRVPSSAIQTFSPHKKPGVEWLQIKVSDTGMGIPPEILPHIFEPFFTTKGPGKGTGLGLAQVYGIVQQHEGYIDVDSKMGGGTIFTVYLPSVPAASEAQETSTLVDDTAMVEGRGEGLLIVEDNTQLREAMCETMELLNYRVLQASNGCEALALLEKADAQVELVISDVVMPEMGGVELCTELRQRGNDVKIIMVTGYSSEEVLAKLRSLGGIDYLQKPLDMVKFAERVEQLLHRQPKSSTLQINKAQAIK